MLNENGVYEHSWKWLAGEMPGNFMETSDEKVDKFGGKFWG
jgi:hypothetical protein